MLLAVSLTDFSKENISALVTACLAVIGGFIAGYCLGMLAAKLFDKFVVRRESPHGLHKVVRYTFGLIVAIIVALIVFNGGRGEGNGGDGSGGGTKPGEKPSGTGTEPTTATATTPATNPETPKIQIDDVLSVKVFAGADVEAGTEKYFQVGNEALDGQAVKVDLKGVKDRVAKAKPAKGNLLVVYDFAPSASLRTSGGIILMEAKDTLGATLLSTEEYQKLRAKQP